MSVLKDILHATREIERRVAHLERQSEEVEEAIKKVRALGCLDAKPYWRPGGYLVLVHRMVAGNRPRQYVGRDEAAIRDAMQRMFHVQKLRALEERRAAITAEALDLHRSVPYTTRLALLWP